MNWILLAEYNIRQCFFKKIEAKRGIIALKKIKVEGEVKTFVVKMQRGLSKGKLAGIVFFEEEIDALVVRFEKFGNKNGNRICCKFLEGKYCIYPRNFSH